MDPKTRGVPANGAAMDWDDVRVFLAIARHGCLRAAGQALWQSQPTMARRLEGLEAMFGGTPLFDRLPEGTRLNAVGEGLIPAAEGVEQAMLAWSGGARPPRRP
ncbi:MAG: LysR family transcriptional regulator [Reyranella sp.]|uniref:LysR family transcriptional regulator n=1 Tax=Reyranella sp. TaxID=1929291 RepID=UPI003D0DA5CA